MEDLLLREDRSHYAVLRTPCLNNGKYIELILKKWGTKIGQGEAMTIEFEAVLLNPFGQHTGYEKKNPFDVSRILQSGNRVVVFWDDGTKTIVKRSDDTDDDIYGAFTAALAIKVYGSNSQVNRIIDCKHEHIEKCGGKSLVIDNYELRKKRRKWDKEREKYEQKSNQ